MKKRALSLFVAVFMVLSLSACRMVKRADETVDGESIFNPITPKVEVAEVRENEVRAEDGALLWYSDYSKVRLSEDTSENFPELSRALSGFSDELRDTVTDGDEEMISFAKEHHEQFPGYSLTLYSSAEVRVRRADADVVSLLIFFDSYSGGAHGMYSYSGAAFDTETGERLLLSDVVADEDAFRRAVAEELEGIREELYLSDTDFNELLEIENIYSWILENDGITVSFAPYSIAPFASGAPTVKVSAAKYPDVIKKEYVNSEKAFGTELCAWIPFFHDIDGDGDEEEIFVDMSGSFEDQDGAISITIDGEKSYEKLLRYESGDATFIKSADGRYFVYMCIYYETGKVGDIYCFELGKADVKISGGLSPHVTYSTGGKPLPFRSTIINPSSFVLDIREDGEEERIRTGEFKLGDEGTPEEKEN